MTVLSPLRRLGLTVVAVAASATLVTACGSSTSGNPLPVGGNSSASAPVDTGSSASSGGVQAGGGTSSESVPVASSAPVTTSGGGGDKAAFCAKLQSLGSDIGTASSGGNVQAVADKFKALADAAPAEIKPDLEKMANYLESVAAGKLPDASATSDYSASVQKVVKYLTSACI